MIKSLTFNQLLTYEGERFAQSFNITIERMLFFRWCQILVPKFWIGFQYWANVWNDSTICLWKTQQEVLDSPVLECRNWRSERPLWKWNNMGNFRVCNWLNCLCKTQVHGWLAKTMIVIKLLLQVATYIELILTRHGKYFYWILF